MKTSLILAIAFLWGAVIPMQAPQTAQALEDPQAVVEEYTRLGRDGSLLTSAGWSKAQIFFLHNSRPLEDIYITENGPAKLAWIKDNKAEVDQEYEPIGKIDKSLHYTPPPTTLYAKTSIAYKLTL